MAGLTGGVRSTASYALILSAAMLATACGVPGDTPTSTATSTPAPTISPQRSPTAQTTDDCPPESPTAEAALEAPTDLLELPLVVLTYLNAGGSAHELAGRFRAQSAAVEQEADPYAMSIRAGVVVQDVTGEGSPEVLVSLDISTIWEEFDTLLVFGCEGSRYVTLFDGEESPLLGAGQLQAMEDLTGDGLVDLVTANDFEVQVLQWNGIHFEKLPFGVPDGPADGLRQVNSVFLSGGDAKVVTGQEGTPGLVLTIGVEPGTTYALGMPPGPQRERSEIWIWDGAQFVLTRTTYGPPGYRFQALQDAHDRLREGYYPEARAFYERVIDDESLLGWSADQWPEAVYAAFGVPSTPTPDPEEQPRLAAHARFGLLLGSVAEGDLTRAEAAYDALQLQRESDPASRPVAELATAFWKAYHYSPDLSSACAQAVGYAAMHAVDLLFPLSGEFYGTENRDYLPHDLCPFAPAGPPPGPTAGATPEPALAQTATPAADNPPAAAQESAVELSPDPSIQVELGSPRRNPLECPAPNGLPQPIVLGDSIDPMESQILAYLNARGSAAGLRTALNQLSIPMEGGWQLSLRALVFGRDVTGDRVPEVVVELTLPGGAASAILILGCDSGQFVRMAAFRDELPSGGQFGWPREFKLLAVADMNLNGVAEIAFHHSAQENCGVHSFCATDTHIIEWDGGEFRPRVLERYYDGNSYDFIHTNGYESYLVTDTDGDGRQEFLRRISLTGGLSFLESGTVPQRDQIEIWAWDGRHFTLARTEPGPPIFRIHAIYDADAAARAGDYGKAQRLYQRALTDETLMSWGPDQDGLAPRQDLGDPAEGPRLNAYALYRLLLLWVVQNEPGEAQASYARLQREFPTGSAGTPYAQLAAAFWQEHQATRDVAAACGKAAAFASGQAPAILAPLSGDFYDPYDLDFNDFFSRDYAPADICPFTR